MDNPFLCNTIEIPTVVGLLRNILTQYPDNGQIIKELVQNAEDAGATQVEVLHDTREVQCPNAHSDIQKFLKGPALCLYNNATFTEDDWCGIRKLSDSIKKDDPLKVGQFGLGFKSVFHITDFVTVISGDKVLFMCPSEPEDVMCRSVHLKNLISICPAEECVHLWHSYLSTQNMSAGHFPATLFWFPLRQNPSKISDTIYSYDHVIKLFESFGVEAPICLTFLKSLEKISLKRIIGNNNNPVITHEVKLTSPAMSEIREKRKYFRQKLKECNGLSAQTITCDYEVTVQSVQLKNTQEETMRVLHFLPGSNEASTVAWRGKDSSTHMPLVGVSAPIRTQGSSWSRGHIFCFLPLPLETANNTNLPIQVNGFFALDQNRRHVKWKTQESSNEPDVLWNEELVSKVVVEAYYTLLSKILQELATRSCDMDTWYSFLPNCHSSKGRWKELSIKLWGRLKSCPILYSEVKGCMMRPADVVTDDSLTSWPLHVSNTVKAFLIQQNFPLVSVPQTVLASLCSVGSSPATVTPQVLRNSLRTFRSVGEEWNRSYLLEYALSDENYNDLEGIPLLPLNNGTWGTFSRSSRSVYVCGEEGGAFFGLEEQFLSTHLATSVYQSMQKIALKGVSQLKQFSASQHGAQLLAQSAQIVHQLALSQQQLECWLSKVWSVMQHLDLQSVSNVALVPCSPNLIDSSKLICLSSAIIVQNASLPLSKAAVAALELLKVQVIPKPPEYVRHHQLYSYFNNSDAQGVSQALLKVMTMHRSQDLACNFNKWRNDEQAQALLTVTEIHNLHPQIVNLYRELNIFKARGKNYTVMDISINNCNKIFPDINNFPVNFPETFIVPSTMIDRHLAKTLGANQLTKEMLCLLALQSTYSDNDMAKLVAYIFEDSYLQSSVGIRNRLQYVRFVPNTSGTLFLPSQIYDPEDVDNAALISEGLNPQTCFQKYYPLLRTLGMKKVYNMPTHDFIQIITNFHSKSLTDEEKVIKAAALLRAANRRPDCQQICQAVRSVSFVYGETLKPADYPASLIWATIFKPYRPQDVKSYSHFRNVLGSVVPLVHCSDIQNVANSLGWNQKPSAICLMEHLRNIIKVYKNTEAKYFDLIKETYKQLSTFVNTPDACHLLSMSNSPCVFTEAGFRDPKKVYVLSQIGDLQLLPHMYSVPFELRDYGSLFRTLGCFEMQSKELFLTLLQQIQQHHSLGQFADVDHDRNIVIQILHKLVPFCKDIPPCELLLPVENANGRLELVDVQQCSYSEQSCDWIDSDELGVRVVHNSVGNKLAKALGVAPLNKHLLAGEEGFMEWGQHEPLTMRLHNLLRQYRDGVAVLKELVQNADDAGATTVSFLYDERQNEDAQTRLMSNKLKECQGPALWAYNNAVFTEEDFSNLRKLGAGTKEYQSTKIGKFGLGFCSVYNLTDVPSIISGSNYIIFDPHMTYLDSNNQMPGVRYNFSKEKNLYMLSKLNGQFKPFNNVFGCNIQQAKKFEGTLFRFPLRTPAQASTSEISSVSYRQKEMIELLQMFSKIIGELLLFTQNIRDIKVFHLNKNASSPTESMLLFESSRTIKKACPSLAVSVLNKTDKTQVERVAQLFNNRFQWNREPFQECTLSEIEVVCSEESRKFCNIHEGVWIVTWLTSWHCGNGASCNLAEILRGKALPLGAVAVPLRKQNDGWQPLKLSELPQGFYNESHMHCFLPLPVTTHLPVQVNGFFEVAPDRTSLKTQTEDDRIVGSDWNETLMNDAISAAYHSLISSLKLEGLSKNCPYYFLWPENLATTDKLVTNFTKHFYNKIISEALPVFRSRSGWHPLNVCWFLEEAFYELEEIGSIAFEYMEKFIESSRFMIVLPNHIVAGFQFAHISEYMITQDMFFSSYFIPNISEQHVTPEKRNRLTLHIFDIKHSCLENLRNVYCIPTIPEGNLKMPSDLIDPKSRIASMFTAADERFPECLFYNNSNRHSILLDLGMNSKSIPSVMVKNRAETVEALSCHNCAVKRSFKILHYIGTQNHEEQNNIAKRIQNVSFLPVMPKPQDWHLTWKGDTVLCKSQMCADHVKQDVRGPVKSVGFSKPLGMCLGEFKELVGSTSLLLSQLNMDNDWISNQLIEKLGIIIHEQNLPLNIVYQQLKILPTVSPAVGNIQKICHKIYKYFENKIQSLNSVIPEELKELRNEKVLLTKHGFMEPNLFALNSESDCSPDLFSVQVEGLGMYKHLMGALGIGPTFHAEVVFQVLSQKKEKYISDKISESEVLQISKLLALLFNVQPIGSGDCELPLHLLHLPDADGYLRPIKNLCCEDGMNLSSGNFHCLHKNISLSLEMTNWLGIKTKTRQRLEDSSNRIHFGQNEPLTTRLKNILKEYPCDSGIMKELLQNADDAGATEVAFIQDLRQLPDKQLFDKKWAPLQGPALSVYNNKGFTQKDLQNIQDLGNSSKIQDPASTGQYGIGFNAVYHLTDAPSFLTRGPDIPQGETLCMFDPHCLYDPMATPEKPGVQLINLNDLRKDHPDSFHGYLEKLFLHQEGTVFRLPLRIEEQSKISDPFPACKLKKMLDEFKLEMAKCLLFLRNVRKISFMSMSEEGECCTEYCVESSIQQENEFSKLQHMMELKKHIDDNLNFVFNIDMIRAKYIMTVTDTNKAKYIWYIVQQLGSENKDSRPEIVKDAFSHKYLSLLPHAGAAVLLNTNQNPINDLFTTSCYLPLPVKSGLPFSVNGHFTLNSSRRNLWTGLEDPKAQWNTWLMKEVLVPAAVCAVDYYRKCIFPESDNKMTMCKYLQNMNLYRMILPDGNKTESVIWKNFVKWFYKYIIDQELYFFDVFIPENDKFHVSAENEYKVVVLQNGELKWHAFKKASDEFPLYFAKHLDPQIAKLKDHYTVKPSDHYTFRPNDFNIVRPSDHIENLLNTLRRLGMKVGSSIMRNKLISAEIEFDLLNSDAALQFLLSWNKDYSDKCNPMIMKHITETPFLSVNNVCIVFRYLSYSEHFLNYLEGLPLLLTNDRILKHFNSKEPVFISSYCHLLPNSAHEFIHFDMVKLFKKAQTDNKNLNVLKEFTLQDLADRLHAELDQSYHESECFLPLGNREKWLNTLWTFIREYFKCNKDEKTLEDIWMKNREYIIYTLGDWSLYPLIYNNQKCLVSLQKAWQVLDLDNDPVSGYCRLPSNKSVFHSLPVPHTFFKIIPTKLNLTATLREPSVLLENLYFHREKIAQYVHRVMKHDKNMSEVLEYFGKYCKSASLCPNKLRSLCMFEDICGAVLKLDDKNFIVPVASKLDLNDLVRIAAVNNTIILKEGKSTDAKTIYQYLNSEYLLEDLEIYVKLILPNYEYLSLEQRTYFFTNLRNELAKTQYEQEENWNQSIKNVVAVLKITPFIELNGSLKTADNFYDPSNPVFMVMKLSNLPQQWEKWEWRYFLKLCGMVHELTVDMYVQYASTLSCNDSEVSQKSLVLTQYLFDNFDKLKCSVSQIINIEFLVPQECEILERILPQFRTASGLVSFSNSVPSKFANILWTTASILPDYATSCKSDIIEHLNIINTPPEEKVLKHIIKLCTFLISKQENTNEGIESIMKSIYEYLQKCSDNVHDALVCQSTPVVHIPKHSTFVAANFVIETLEDEIIPYLYKVPVTYGKYIDLFKKLGALEAATCDTYAQILKMIYEESRKLTLHPEESKCMKLALEGLVKNKLNLEKLQVSELYLPTKEGKLEKSSEIYVIDNEYLEVRRNLNISIFAGFKILEIDMTDCDFVNLLPKNLQPKFLSHTVKEDLDSNTEEISTELLNELRETLHSITFKQAVLRIINHDRVSTGLCLNKTEDKELMTSLDRVEVRQFKVITIIQKFNGDEVGKLKRQFFVKVCIEVERKVTLYISENITSTVIGCALCKTYRTMLKIDSPSVVENLGNILRSYDKPHEIPLLLDELSITAWGVQNRTEEFYQTDVGSYLGEHLIHLLDNEFCQFHEGEIVCMKKYILAGIETAEENIYIIVQVKCLVRSHESLFMNEYEVDTGYEGKSCMIVRAHQLYKFVRTNANDSDMVINDTVSAGSESDNLSEEEIRKTIRKQMKEIWKVNDEKERQHLLRRLILKWHPDKNSHRVELSTRVMQYIQLLNRLENGEIIPDDEDDENENTFNGASSNYYSNVFKSPLSTQSTGSFGSFRSLMYERKMPDRPEAQKWFRQAEHDLGEANRRDGGSSCWIMYMCHQSRPGTAVKEVGSVYPRQPSRHQVFCCSSCESPPG
ncbi:sacsin-like isoform X2 [Procambarus clarkii]|uniref:sacsin-like isoform X2 n=1 Tax=Procambarus clarkii TaxID=6728 RepID=UPI0037440D1C